MIRTPGRNRRHASTAPVVTADGRPGLAWIWVHAAVAVGCDAAYLAVIAGEGNVSVVAPVVAFVATYVAGLAVASALAAHAHTPPARGALLWWAAAGSLGTGLLGAFSLVMLPLIPAALPLIVLAERTRAMERSAGRPSPILTTVIGPALLAVVVLVLGLVVANAIEPA